MKPATTERATLAGKEYDKIYRNGRIFWRETKPNAAWLEQCINQTDAYGTSTFFKVTDVQTQATLDKILRDTHKSS